MNHQQEAVYYGGPQFWETAPEEFRRFRRVSPRLQDALNDLTTRGYPNIEPYQKVILNLAMLTAISMLELTTLVESGLGPGAMKIARSMLEYAVNAEYLRRFPAEYEDYRDWMWVDQIRLIRYMQANAPHLLRRIDDQQRERAEREFELVRARFEYQTNRGPRFRSGWCARSLAARAAATDFSDPYRLTYPFGSQMLHGSFGGLAAQFSPEEDQHRIAVPPSLEWCREALVGGHLCVLRIVDTLANTVGIDLAQRIHQLIDDYRQVWRKAPEMGTEHPD